MELVCRYVDMCAHDTHVRNEMENGANDAKYVKMSKLSIMCARFAPLVFSVYRINAAAVLAKWPLEYMARRFFV